MTGPWEICHHVLCSLIPWSVGFVSVSSVPLLFWSRPQERPMIASESASIIRNCLVNCIHIFLRFLLLTIQCRCALTWRWSCLWSAQVHTIGLSLDFLGIFSTRTPSAFSENLLILLFQVAIGSSPIFPTQSTESEKTWALALVSWQALLHHKLVDVHSQSLKIIALTTVISFCSPISFSFSLITVPHEPKNDSSRIVDSPHGLVQDELLLEEKYSEICPQWP